MDAIPSVEVTGLGRTYARIHGFRDDQSTWAEHDGPPPVTPERVVDVYITRLPFAIGKTRSSAVRRKWGALGRFGACNFPGGAAGPRRPKR